MKSLFGIGNWRPILAMRGRRPENEIQRCVFQHIRTRWCCRSGHDPCTQRRLPATRLGVTAGTPDLLLWHEGRSYALELKAEDGRVSESQADMLNRLGAAGVVVAVCHGIDAALATLEGWQRLRGSMA